MYWDRKGRLDRACQNPVAARLPMTNAKIVPEDKIVCIKYEYGTFNLFHEYLFVIKSFTAVPCRGFHTKTTES